MATCDTVTNLPLDNLHVDASEIPVSKNTDSVLESQQETIEGTVSDIVSHAMDPEAMSEVRIKLSSNGLSTAGSDFVLRSRLRLFEKREQGKKNVDGLQYLIVIDFEATCEAQKAAGSYEQEIIEFPAVLIDVQQKVIIDEFHAFCRPRKHKLLSEFCTSLVGVTQEEIDAAEEFPQVLRKFERWLNGYGLFKTNRWCLVTDGSFDLSLFLHCQLKISGLPAPCYLKLFNHLPKFFQWIYLSDDPSKHRANMVNMLEHLGMTLEGRHHSGISDARNLARICVQMLEDGVQFRPTDVVNFSEVDSRRPYCAAVLTVHKIKWRPVQKSLMKNLALCMPREPL